jgi:hypothetical protein
VYQATTLVIIIIIRFIVKETRALSNLSLRLFLRISFHFRHRRDTSTNLLVKIKITKKYTHFVLVISTREIIIKVVAASSEQSLLSWKEFY